MQNGQFLVLMVYVSSFTKTPHFILIAKKYLLWQFLVYLQLQMFCNTNNVCQIFNKNSSFNRH